MRTSPTSAIVVWGFTKLLAWNTRQHVANLPRSAGHSRGCRDKSCEATATHSPFSPSASSAVGPQHLHLRLRLPGEVIGEASLFRMLQVRHMMVPPSALEPGPSKDYGNSSTQNQIVIYVSTQCSRIRQACSHLNYIVRLARSKASGSGPRLGRKPWWLLSAKPSKG